MIANPSARIDNFERIYAKTARLLVKDGQRVGDKPHQMQDAGDEWAPVELTNVVFEYSIPMTRQALAIDVRPSRERWTPGSDYIWAEEHFQERVSGEPLNPPPSYERWPYTQRGHEDHLTIVQPELDQRQWAYLAAFLDGEGCITMRQGRPAIQFSQKDHDFLLELAADTGAGKTYIRPPRTTGVGVLSQPCVWHITSTQEMMWFLRGTIPYLKLKKAKAKKALKALEDRDPHHAIKVFGEEGQPRFSHTYPERIWASNLHGRRFRYGDLNDLISLLAKNPYTRQAYLPIWHPEDGSACLDGERVPCTLGYHFLMRDNKLNLFYPIRSCDLVRFMRDDVYMACRLVQWVLSFFKNQPEDPPPSLWDIVRPGTLTMHIVSLHCFEGDLPLLGKNYA